MAPRAVDGRDSRGHTDAMTMLGFAGDVFKDLRYGVRLLARSPTFAIVATLSLAIGIGGAASVFAVLNGVLLRTLPVPDAHHLFAPQKILQRGDVSPRYSWPSFQQARDDLKGRAELCAATGTAGLQLRPGGAGAPPAERGLVQLVSGEYFEVLRQQPQVGRLLNAADNLTVGAHPVAVISNRYWERAFGRSADVVGRELVINGAPFTIVGVASPRFFGTVVALRNPEVWIPLMMQPTVRYAFNASSSGGADSRLPWPPQSEIEWLNVFARIAPPNDSSSLAATLTVQHQRERSRQINPSDTDAARRVSRERVLLEPVARGISTLRGDLQTPLLVLLAMVGVLTAIVCGNLASLLLARANTRDREIAIRLAIGAGRFRIVRQLIAESLLLAAVGGALGLAAAAWGRDVLLAMFAPNTTAIDLDTTFDWRVLGVVAGLTTFTGIAASLVPAWRSTRVALAESLKIQARTVGPQGGWRGVIVGKALVAAQMAFCALLLVVAGLFARSLQSLLQIDVGFDRAHLLVARLDVRSTGYSAEQRQILYRQVLDAVRAVPGVISASLSLNGPLSTSERIGSLSVEGYTPSPEERMSTNEEYVTEDYFSTVGIRLIEGRLFESQDRQSGRRSSVINETMAKRYFKGQSPVGKHWSYGGPVKDDSFVIVGVVRDARYVQIRHAPPNMIYHPVAASADAVLANLEVRTSIPPTQAAADVRNAVHRTAPALPLFEMMPLEQRVARGVSRDRLVANLSGTFAAIALLLACLGLYGTISYSVSRRGSELGVRMALGASQQDVLRLILREALVLVVAGGLVGLPLAFVAGTSLGSMLYGVPPGDAAPYLSAAALLIVVAGGAAWMPAYRASRIDPMVALRKE
jgi:predicted permease